MEPLLERQQLCSAVRCTLLGHLKEVLLLGCAPVSSLNKYIRLCTQAAIFFFYFYSQTVLCMFKLYQNEKIKKRRNVFTTGIKNLLCLAEEN